MAESFEVDCEVLKVDTKLGLVFGWGMICSKGGKPYSDLDRERITTGEMLKACTDFALNTEQLTDDMHDEEDDGSVVFSFPVTDEIAKVFGFAFDRSKSDQVTEGWMVAIHPSASVLGKFQSGEYTGFSIGGDVEGWDDDHALEATG